jgi:protein-S-isoprenylcysteine O-methyltransferase Ste14
MNSLPRSTNWAWLMIQLVFLAAVFAAGLLWPGVDDSWLRHPTFGLVMMIISARIGLVGCLTLRSSLSAFPQPRPTKLATKGLYRWLRHPMYSGLVVLALGWVFYTGSIAALIATVLLWWFLKRKAALEDRMLSQVYPEHARYASQTWCLFSGRAGCPEKPAESSN